MVPVRARFVDDCETPVSAFLKLRAGEPEGAPCFLLESAEQGQVGRYSFVGLRPRAVLRWSDGVLSEWSGEAAPPAATPSRSEPAPDPYAAVAARLARLPAGAGRGPAAVRRRRRRLLRLRPGAHRRAARRAEPRPARAARHGADGHRRDARLRPPAPRADDPRLRLRRGRGRRSTPPTSAPPRRSPRCASACAAPCRCPAQPVGRRAAASSSPTWSARSSKPRSRGSSSTSTPATPSRSSPRSASRAPAPVEAFSVYRGLRAVNPSPYMYFLEFGDFQIAGASPEPLVKVERRPGRDAADRRHLPARRAARTRTAASPSG